MAVKKTVRGTSDVKTAVVLLAAGQGKRFGGDKLVADFCGRPLWEWAAETAENIDVCERAVVVSPNSPIKWRPRWRFVENPRAESGIGTSIAAGVRALNGYDRLLIVLADMPLVSHTHLDRILAVKGVAFTQYPDGTAGCPAMFPRSVFPFLEALTGDRGARSLGLANAELVFPDDENEHADVDEARDLDRLSSARRQKR